jgi:CRISPR-associated protein Cas2
MVMPMRYLLIYDIVHDGTRAKVADACLDYGLERIQLSAFTGELSKVHLQELWVKIQSRVGRHTAKVYLYPLDEQCWQGRRLLERVGEE